jgi:hypothetical protein
MDKTIYTLVDEIKDFKSRDTDGTQEVYSTKLFFFKLSEAVDKVKSKMSNVDSVPLLVDVGHALMEVGELTAAMDLCFSFVLHVSDVDLPAEQLLSLQLDSSFSNEECRYLRTLEKDRNILYPHTVNVLLSILQNVHASMQVSI